MSEQYFKHNSEVNPIELGMVEMFTQFQQGFQQCEGQGKDWFKNVSCLLSTCLIMLMLKYVF